jgi:hypothetical protein
MAVAKTMSGARAKVSFIDPQSGQALVAGFFSNISYGLVYDHQAAYILGRYSASELQYTAVEVVSISASGWRTFNHGRHVGGRLPRIQDLLLHEPLEMIVTDRQHEALGQEARVAKLRNVLPTTSGEGYTIRQLAEMTLSYVGLIVDDENTENAEHPTAADLP